MIRIGICDDVEQEALSLEKMTRRIMERKGRNVETSTYLDGEELLEGIRTEGSLDMLFLDVEMEGQNGIEAAKEIRKTDFEMTVVFVSGHDQYFRAMIEVEPFSFMGKPVNEKELENVLTQAVNKKLDIIERYEFFSNKRRYRIPVKKIKYFESMGRQVYVYSTEGEYVFYKKLNDVEKELGKSSVKFLRMQVSYLINPTFVREWGYEKVVMDGGKEIPISKKYRKMVRERYMDDILRK